MESSNLINTGLNDTGFHTGLANIRQRLLHAYGTHAEIITEVNGQYFKVLINI
ncbi:hypothetical protein [Pedobacter sp. Leaf216]|uniref:hypothetical protein n=1 Tax=Pedobacter sp. Leaf216 TaxID=1735684 RepID=UPI000A77B3A9|nr:hypothetical protein [Pedobacter sp. Leaf216]